jgi:hypothetical protein
MAVAVVVGAVTGVALLGGGNSGDDDHDDESDVAAVTTSTRPPLEESGDNLSQSSQLGGVIDGDDSDSHLFSTWHPVAPGEDLPIPDTAEPVGPNPDGGATSIAAITPGDGDPLTYRWTVYDDGYVESIAVGMTRDQVLATGIERNDPTAAEFTLTPPAGFEVVGDDPPG